MTTKAGKLGLVVNLGATPIISWVVMAYANGRSTTEPYSVYCAQCDGETGHDDGPSANTLRSPPQNFADCKALVTISDAVLFKASKQGGLPDSMRSWGAALDDDQIDRLTGYLRQFL